MEPLLLAIDQGTSSTKVLLFNRQGQVVSQASAPLHTEYLSDGRVEQNPLDILKSVASAAAACLQHQPNKNVVGIGISNQRETFVLWDREGTPLGPAIVWSCKRSTHLCETLKPQEPEIHAKTGLLIDPYFSGTKLLWLVENQPELAQRIAAGDVYFGTVDTWLLFNLTGGASYFTDHTNASRTLFFNLNTLHWDTEILNNWGLTNLNLPEVKNSSDSFGSTKLFDLFFNPVPILAMIGDSHAALFGEGCFTPGDTKITLGTGCSLLSHSGSTTQPGTDGLLNTIGWSSKDGVVFAREGAIVACGSQLTWLQGIGVIDTAQESEALARQAVPDDHLFLIPAFSGLGAPFWQANRKASFHGMHFGTTREQLVRATLESIAFQIKAVLDSMEHHSGVRIKAVALHGGLTRNTWLLEFLSGILSADLQLQDNSDISAQGAALLAGYTAGIFATLTDISELLHTRIVPSKPNSNHLSKYQNWLNLINSSKS